jgi:hypothetical protein
MSGNKSEESKNIKKTTDDVNQHLSSPSSGRQKLSGVHRDRQEQQEPPRRRKRSVKNVLSTSSPKPQGLTRQLGEVYEDLLDKSITSLNSNNQNTGSQQKKEQPEKSRNRKRTSEGERPHFQQASVEVTRQLGEVYQYLLDKNITSLSQQKKEQPEGDNNDAPEQTLSSTPTEILSPPKEEPTTFTRENVCTSWKRESAIRFDSRFESKSTNSKQSVLNPAPIVPGQEIKRAVTIAGSRMSNPANYSNSTFGTKPTESKTSTSESTENENSLLTMRPNRTGSL